MIERNTAIGAAIGFAAWLSFLVVHSLWQECKQRRIQYAKDRQVQREHERHMMSMAVQYDSVDRVVNKRHGFDTGLNAIAFPPSNEQP